MNETNDRTTVPDDAPDDIVLDCGHVSCAQTEALVMLRAYLTQRAGLNIDGADYWIYSHADLVYEAQ